MGRSNKLLDSATLDCLPKVTKPAGLVVDSSCPPVVDSEDVPAVRRRLVARRRGRLKVLLEGHQRP